MVEETIKTIKETESEAEEILKAADVPCTSILEKAAASANEIKEQSVEKAKEKSKAARSAAKDARDISTREALARVDEEIAELKKAAQAKEKEAIDSVIAELV